MRRCATICSPIQVEPLEALGFDGDATEAQAFAFLAVRAVDANALSFPLTTGVAGPLSAAVSAVRGALVNPGQAFLWMLPTT